MAFVLHEAKSFIKFNKKSKENSYFLSQEFVNEIYGLYVKKRKRNDKNFEKFINKYITENWDWIDEKFFI